jgi:methylated-DNA-[protein]-cysteine S-methyltransferase
MTGMEEDDRAFEAWLGDAEGTVAAHPLMEALDRLYTSGPGPGRTQQALDRAREMIRRLQSEVVYYDSLADTPVGPLFIALTNKGIVALEYSESATASAGRLRQRGSYELIHSREKVSHAAREVMDYLEGRRADFDLPLDLTGLTTFQRLVLLAVVGVPRGKVATYAEIARKIDRPRAARAVGQALRRNPIPIVIPCHRVLASDGGLGGYTGRGGLRTKKQLLSLEGVRLGAV